MRDTTFVNKLVFPNIKRLATQPGISVQRPLLIIRRLCAFCPPSSSTLSTTLPGQRMTVAGKTGRLTEAQRRIPLYTSGLEKKEGRHFFYSAFSAACPEFACGELAEPAERYSPVTTSFNATGNSTYRYGICNSAQRALNFLMAASVSSL